MCEIIVANRDNGNRMEQIGVNRLLTNRKDKRMVSRRLGIFTALLGTLVLANPAFSGEWRHHGGHDGWGHRHHHHRGHGNRLVIYGGGYGVPVVIPHNGTYSGTISAVRIRGIGTYFYAEGLGGDVVRARPVPAPAAKIVNVDKRKDPCSYEAGVCVIRP